MTFDGKVTLVTGAGSGMGRAASIILLKREHVANAADINLGEAEATAQAIRKNGGRAIPSRSMSGRHPRSKTW